MGHPKFRQQKQNQKAKLIEYLTTILLLTILSLSLSLKSLNETPNREFDASFKDFYVKSALELYVATWFWKMGEIS